MGSPNRIGRFAGVVLAVLVVVSLVSGLAVAAFVISDSGDTEIEPADDVYLTDDGAVAVYTDDDVNAEDATAEFGADVVTGLVNAIVEMEDEDFEQTEGEIGVELRESVVTGEGDITVTDVEEVDEFTLTAEGEHSRETSFVRSEFDGVLTGEQPVPPADVSGELSLTADQLSFGAGVQLGDEPTGDDIARQFAVTISEVGDGFDVDVEERREISFGAEQWADEENATRALEQQFGAIAQEFDGSAEVTVTDHDFTEGDDETPATLDIAYVVEMNDVRDGLTEVLVQGVVEEGDDLVGEAEAQALRESLNELEIEEVSVSFVEGIREEVSAEMSVVLGDYQSSVLAALELAEKEGTVDSEQVDEVRATFDAQAAANLEQTVTWAVTTGPAEGVDEPGASAVTGEVAYETDNWDAYLQERYGDDPDMTEAEFDATLSAEDERVDADFSFRIDHGDFTEMAVDEVVGEFREDTDVGDDELAFLDAFDDADIQVAKSDILFGSDTVEVRAAGQFDNLSAFANLYDGPGADSVTHIYGETPSDGDGETFVYISEESLTEETVKETPFVGDNTTVHAAGEWDREFGEMDTVEAADYLGVDIATDNGDGNDVDNGDGNDVDNGDGNDVDNGDGNDVDNGDGNDVDDGVGDDTDDTDGEDVDDDGPGFGIVAAAVGLLALALMARRGRQ